MIPKVADFSDKIMRQNNKLKPDDDSEISHLALAMRQYIALIHKEADTDYGVSFPDIPGCITAGQSLDEARGFAEEALALHLLGLAEEGEPVPEPSSLEAIMADRDNRDGVAVLVAARGETPKAAKLEMDRGSSPT